METWSVRTGKIKSAATNLNQYFDLRERDEISKREIAKLKSLLLENRYSTIAETEAFLDSTSAQRFSYLSASIINRNPYNPNNTFVIDRGSDYGVAPGQGVVDEHGLLGIIDLVTPRYARAISILHGATRISAGLKDGTFGTLRWDGQDPRRMTVTDIPDYISVTPGDTLYTTGFSNVYPTNQVIGTVESTEIQAGTGNQVLYMLLSNTPLQARYAFVVQDLDKEEIEQLQEQ